MTNCIECQRQFEYRSNKIFCRIECRSKFHAKGRDWRRANTNRRDRQPKIKEKQNNMTKTCPNCQTQFTSKTRKYCTDECTLAARATNKSTKIKMPVYDCDLSEHDDILDEMGYPRIRHDDFKQWTRGKDSKYYF